MGDRIRIPVFSKMSNSPEKGWNIAVGDTTTVQEILVIVSRALKFDPSMACIYASQTETETIMNPSDLILSHFLDCKKGGIKAKYIVRDKIAKGGTELFDLINTNPPLNSPSGNRPKQRSINVTNTVHSFTGQSNERNRVSRNSSDIPLRMRKSSLACDKKDLQAKKQQLLNLLSEYSKKLANPLEPTMMAHYQDNIRKANVGISHINQRIAQIELKEQQDLAKKRSSESVVTKSTSATRLEIPHSPRFTPNLELADKIIIPQDILAKFSLGDRNLHFNNLLALLQIISVPAVQEQALQIVVALCQIPENQTLLLRTNLVLILLTLIDSPTTDIKRMSLACWSMAMLSSHESNKEQIELAGGIPIFTKVFTSSNTELSEHAATILINILNSRNSQLHKAFRAARGICGIGTLLNSPSTNTAQKVNALRMMILLGLSAEEKLQLANEETMQAIMKLTSSGDSTAQKLSIMVTSSFSSIEETRIWIYKSPQFQEILAYLATEKADPRVVEKIVILINNIALSQEYLCDSISLITSLVNHSDNRVKTKSIHCLSNLVLIDDDHLEAFYTQKSSLQSIITNLNDSNDSTITSAVRVLVNISRDSSLANSIRSKLGELGIISSLVSLLKEKKSPEIQEQALKAFVNISLTYQNEKAYLSSNLSNLLISFFTSSNNQLVECSVATLVNITRTSDKCRESIRLQNAEALETVLSLCNSPTFDIQIYACKAITNLALNGRTRFFFQQSDKYTSLLEDLSNSDATSLSEAASAALRNISFPCEDYSEDSSSFASNTQMEDLIKETAIQVEKIEGEEKAPISKNDALLKVRSIRNFGAQQRDFLDDFFSELAKNSNGTLTKKEAKKLQEEQRKIHQAEQDIKQKASLLSISKLNHLKEMGNAYKQKKDIILLGKQEQQILEQRKQLEKERIKLAAERNKFDEEKRRLGVPPYGACLDDSSDSSPKVTTADEKREKPKRKSKRGSRGSEKYHTRRTKIAVEILVTERSYVDSLNTMVNKYMNPLHGYSYARRSVLDISQVHEVFSNIEEIINYHTMLLEGLERRVSKFDASTCLGEFFISMTDYLRCYTTYVNNYNNAIATLSELEENSDFEAKLKYLTDNGIKGKSIYTYLIMPIQRIPRYILLLNELIKHTKDSHPDYVHLKDAVAKMEILADYIDESKEAYNENKFVVGLQKRIHGFPKGQTLVAPNRILVKNAPLIMNQSDYWVFLFTDILVQTQPIVNPTKDKKKKKKDEKEWPHYQFVRLISLEHFELFYYPDSAVVTQHAFTLRGPEYTFNCSTNTREEKIYWSCAFKETVVSVL